jgi:hypothetical protein
VSEFGRVLADLNAAGVRYVVVGGIAVIGHGVIRATKDVDVVIATDDEAAAALRPVLGGWGGNTSRWGQARCAISTTRHATMTRDWSQRRS